MTRKVELGAPSPSGKGANKQVADEFGKSKFPIKLLVKNHAPRNVVFPEASGLALLHCASATGDTKEVEITSLDQLQRLASSAEQIAALNAYEVFLTIEEVETAPAPKISKAAPTAPTV